jgi:hypothetical protein
MSKDRYSDSHTIETLGEGSNLTIHTGGADSAIILEAGDPVYPSPANISSINLSAEDDISLYADSWITSRAMAMRFRTREDGEDPLNIPGDGTLFIGDLSLESKRDLNLYADGDVNINSADEVNITTTTAEKWIKLRSHGVVISNGYYDDEGDDRSNNTALLVRNYVATGSYIAKFQTGAENAWKTRITTGGQVQCKSLRVEEGAVIGHLLTSDGSGNATWAAPADVMDDTVWGDQSADDFNINSTGASPSGYYRVTANEDIAIKSTSYNQSKLVTIEVENLDNNLWNYLALGDGGGTLPGVELSSTGTTDRNGWSTPHKYRIGMQDAAAHCFTADFEGFTGPRRYVADILNKDTSGGNHRILRLAFGYEGDGATEADGTGGEDFYLVCAHNGGETTGGTTDYWIDGTGATGTSLTGMHWVVYKSHSGFGNHLYGMIVISSGEIFNKPKITEALPVVEMCDSSNDKRVYGVLSSERGGMEMRQFLEFSKPYHESCRGENDVDSSNYSDDSPYYKARVNSLGEGQVWVTNCGGEILNGDYITSSNIAGHGMKQDDDILHNYTVAKCVQDIDWDSISDTVGHDGVQYKKYLTACTYHCG